MPLLILVKLITSIMSLSILAGAGYLGWTWYEGGTYLALDDSLVFVRESWRLWAAVALGAFSLCGRFVAPFALAKKDDARSQLNLKRGKGEVIYSPTGARIYLERHGDPSKPPLIFTHGWGLDSTIWDYAKRDLAAEFHLVFWDLPGLGKSKRGVDRRTSPDRFSEDLQTVIQFTEAKQVILIGHSIGGMTIQTLVRDNPAGAAQSIAGIALLNTTYTNPIKTVAASNLVELLRWPVLEPLLFATRVFAPLAWLDAWRAYLSGSAHLANRIQFGKRVTRSQLNAVALLGTRNPPGALARGNQGMFRWDAAGAMKNFSGPVLVIGGKLDLATKVEASRIIAADASGSQLIEVEDVNHCGFLEKSALYNEAIAVFARGVWARSRSLEPASATPAR